MTVHPSLVPLKNQRVVSCQATPEEPLHGSVHMAAMARAAAEGGAAAIRANGPEDVAAICAAVDLPVIGIYKQHHPGFEVFITPTFESARLVVEAGANIIALDGSARPRPDGMSLRTLVSRIHNELGVPVMAHPGPHFQDMSLDVDRPLNYGDLVSVGHHTIRVYHTPGHIDDLVCFALWDAKGEGDQRVIVGDTLFEGGPGKTWSNAGFRETLKTLHDVVLAWSDETVCYPGHGDSFRLGDIRPDVEYFLAKDHGDFYGDATWDM